MSMHLEERLELKPVAEEHLAACLSCRQRVASMRELIDAQRLRFEAEAPDWERQRQEVLLRLPSVLTAGLERRRWWTRPLLAVAAVLVAAIGLKALWMPPPSSDPMAGYPMAGLELPVEQILAEVDAMLADDSIPGFELIDPGLDDAIFENGAS